MNIHTKRGVNYMSKRVQLFNKKTWENVNKENKNILDDYVLELRSKKKSDGTIYQYTADIKAFYCWVHDNMKNKSVLDLKKRDFRNFFLFLEEKSPARINRVQCSIRNLLEFCTQDDDEYDEYEINVMRNIKGLQKEKVRDIHFLTNKQIELILEHLLEQGQFQKALYLTISYETIARRNEIAQIEKHSFVKGENMTNIVVGKRNKKFPLYYFNKSKEIASMYLRERGEDNIDSLWIVGKGENKRPASYETLYNWTLGFRDILKEKTGEYIEFGPHSFRHSGMENLENGTHYILSELGKDRLDIKIIKIMAHHEDISTTESYLKNKDEQVLLETFGL